jgi:hypothetical protein
MESIHSNIEQRVKDAMGENYPKNLVFEVCENRIRFYNSPTPYKDSIYEGDTVDEDDLKMIVDNIKLYHNNICPIYQSKL